MESIQKKVKADMVSAMKDKDAVRLETVRSMMSAFTNELVALGRTPQDALTDEEALKVITKLAKQRKDSITQYESVSRAELADKEKAELAVLEAYLPEQMSDSDLESVVATKINELGISDKSDIGKLMGALSRDLKGKADGGRIKVMAEKLLV